MITNEKKGLARGSKPEIEEPKVTHVKTEDMPEWAKAIWAATTQTKTEPKAEPAIDMHQPCHTRVKLETQSTPTGTLASPRESTESSPAASPPMTLKPRLAVSELEFRDAHSDKV